MAQTELDPNNPIKEYTGVWIPREVMECEQLTPVEKIAYGEIASFTKCYASNAWLAKRIGKSESTARNCVSKLKKLGFIEDCGFNGRFRTVRVLKNSQSACEKINTIDKSIDKSIDTASQPKVAPQTSRKKSEFNLLIEKLCEILSLDVTKLNWSAVGKWHKVGKASNCTDEDFIKAAEAMRDAAKSNGFTVSLQKVLTNTEYWLRQAEDKKPKRGMIVT